MLIPALQNIAWTFLPEVSNCASLVKTIYFKPGSGVKQGGSSEKIKRWRELYRKGEKPGINKIPKVAGSGRNKKKGRRGGSLQKMERNRDLRPSNTGNIFVQLVVQQCCRCKLRLFVARITTFSRNKFSCCRK